MYSIKYSSIKLLNSESEFNHPKAELVIEKNKSKLQLLSNEVAMGCDNYTSMTVFLSSIDNQTFLNELIGI